MDGQAISIKHLIVFATFEYWLLTVLMYIIY